ncbi:hypothetical protein [Enorma phocaeensis]|uniref:hypothetical protein n=1 Tax=Enorma phocaeensis TaxID=1871019 RepID=UPI00195DECDC|nr:hypothetical protein [Enorma phocaeensis]MBM6952511.1 hypothetical protein [Enorma phocaeensis]
MTESQDNTRDEQVSSVLDDASAPTVSLADASAGGPGGEGAAAAARDGHEQADGPRADVAVEDASAAFFADACERASIAEQEMRERDEAIRSLAGQPSTTWTLPGGSRSVTGTQKMPKVPEASADEPKPAGHDGDSAEVTESRTRRNVIVGVIAAVAVVAAIAIGGFFVMGGPALFAQVSVADVERTLEADADFMDGFASNDYVTPSAYDLSNVEIVNTGEGQDGSVTVQATALLTNESFESDCSVTLLFVRAGDASSFAQFSDIEAAGLDRAAWVGVVLDSSAATRAISGVTEDAEISGDFTPTFDEASQTCTFTTETSYDLWFGTRSVQTPYTYSFDGDAWTRSQGDAQSSVSYSSDALVGEYTSQGGDATRMTAFRVTNVDAAAGTFVVEYQATPSGFGSEAISGVITCTISAVTATDAARGYRQADGYAYAFTGDGSSTGGDNTAHIEGYLGLDGAIVFDFTGDYTRMPFLFGDPTNESTEIAGTVVKG